MPLPPLWLPSEINELVTVPEELGRLPLEAAPTPPQIREGSRLFRAKLRKELVVRCELALPKVSVQAHHLPEALRAKVEAAPVEIAILGLQPERVGGAQGAGHGRR